jgi:hypothetical protein
VESARGLWEESRQATDPKIALLLRIWLLPQSGVPGDFVGVLICTTGSHRLLYVDSGFCRSENMTPPIIRGIFGTGELGLPTPPNTATCVREFTSANSPSRRNLMGNRRLRFPRLRFDGTLTVWGIASAKPR